MPRARGSDRILVGSPCDSEVDHVGAAGRAHLLRRSHFRLGRCRGADALAAQSSSPPHDPHTVLDGPWILGGLIQELRSSVRLLTRPAGASVLSFGEGHCMRWREFAAAVARWCFGAIVSLNNEGLRASALLFAS